MGSVTAIAVNTDKITDTITSYADLFDAKYAGDIVMLDDYREVLGIAAESIGVSNNETDESKLELVRAQVMKLKDNIKVYDSDSPKSALINGDCVLGAIWSAEIALAQRENPAIQIVFPKEGAEISTDNWVIPTNAKNVDNAMKFLDYMLGSGNVGLVVGFQLLQAGCDVVAIVDAAPRVGGYGVHAAKLARCGVPFYLSHTIVSAEGHDRVTGVTIGEVDKAWRIVPGTERHFDVDTICVAVGLSPMAHETCCSGGRTGEVGGFVSLNEEDVRRILELSLR